MKAIDFSNDPFLEGKERPRHFQDAFSRKHPPMSLLKRAKIFTPFDALQGFSSAIRAQGSERSSKTVKG